jgi:GNAT superfamily N-acetyltransferase
MIELKRADKDHYLDGILLLQSQNLKANVSLEEQAEQGFVTAQHTFKELKNINDAENAIIATVDDKVVAYAIAMRKETGLNMPVFDDLFSVLYTLEFDNKPVKDYEYIIIGQLCVAKEYRGQGLVQKLYAFYKECLKSKYAFGITDISTQNPRSLKAHQNAGFEKIHTFYDKFTDSNWDIVLFDFRD